MCLNVYVRGSRFLNISSSFIFLYFVFTVVVVVVVAADTAVVNSPQTVKQDNNPQECKPWAL